MTKSEQLLQGLSQMYFFQDLRLKDCCYFPEPGEQYPALILYLDNTMIALELKKQPEYPAEDWMEQASREGVRQVENLWAAVHSEAQPPYANPDRGLLPKNPQATIFSLIVLDDGEGTGDYAHVMKMEKPAGVHVNCMRFSDYQRLCCLVAVPMEVIHFLYYRAVYFSGMESGGDRDTAMGDEELCYQFLFERYRYNRSNIQKFRFEEFRDFLRKISQKPEKEAVIRFLSHLARGEIGDFMDRVDMLSQEARRHSSGLQSSLRPKDYQYALFFVAGAPFPSEVLRQMIYGCADVRHIMEVVGRAGPDGTVNLEFILNYNF